MEEAVIIDGARIAFGSFGGSLKDTGVEDMGVEVAKAAIERSGVDKKDIVEIVLGNVIQSGVGPSYHARHIGTRVGLSQDASALAVNRLCGSGMEAVIQGARKIYLNEGEVVLACGSESMSQAPYISRSARYGARYGHAELEDSLIHALTDSMYKAIMGITAENLAEKYKISREEQDEWAGISQERAEKATVEGRFKDEIIPITVGGRTPVVFEKDEFIRGAASKAKMSSLKPAFKEGGTVTAANASGINDGAGALIVASASYAKKIGKTPLAKIKGYGISGCDAQIMGIGPAYAIPKALKMAGLSMSDIGLFEVNEAFAAQYLAVQKELKLDPAITNVNGGAIAIGHPLGASGSRVTLTLAYEMKRRKVKYGVASLCIGGGQGIAIVLENPLA